MMDRMITKFKIFENTESNIIENIQKQLRWRMSDPTFNNRYVSKVEYENYQKKYFPDLNILDIKGNTFINKKEIIPIEIKKSHFDDFFSYHSIPSGYWALSVLNIIIKNYKKHLKLCDLGCGIGNIIYFAKRLGYETMGVEIQPQYNDRYKELGLNVINDDLITMDFSFLSDFDVIYFYRPISNPSLMMYVFNRVYKELKKNALIVFSHTTMLNFEGYKKIYDDGVDLTIIQKI
jgi:uncharacterized UPF0146 family protein